MEPVVSGNHAQISSAIYKIDRAILVLESSQASSADANSLLITALTHHRVVLADLQHLVLVCDDFQLRDPTWTKPIDDCDELLNARTARPNNVAASALRRFTHQRQPSAGTNDPIQLSRRLTEKSQEHVETIVTFIFCRASPIPAPPIDRPQNEVASSHEFWHIISKIQDAANGSGNESVRSGQLLEAWKSICKRAGLKMANGRTPQLPLERIRQSSTPTMAITATPPPSIRNNTSSSSQSSNAIASILYKSRVIELQSWEWKRSDYTLHWAGMDPKTTLVHYLPFNPLPWAMHSSVHNSPFQVRFHEEHRMILVLAGVKKYDQKMLPEYNFHARDPYNQFQANLRGKTFVNAFEFVKIRSVASGDRKEAENQVLHFWDNDKIGLGSHTLSFWASAGARRKELEFPILCFEHNPLIGKIHERGTSVTLVFRGDGPTKRDISRLHSSSSSDLDSIKSSSLSPITTGKAEIIGNIWSELTPEEKALIDSLQALKINFSHDVDVEQFVKQFQDLYDIDSVSRWFASLPASPDVEGLSETAAIDKELDISPSAVPNESKLPGPSDSPLGLRIQGARPADLIGKNKELETESKSSSEEEPLDPATPSPQPPPKMTVRRKPVASSSYSHNTDRRRNNNDDWSRDNADRRRDNNEGSRDNGDGSRDSGVGGPEAWFLTQRKDG